MDIKILRMMAGDFHGRTYEVGANARQGAVSEFLEDEVRKHFVAECGALPGKSRRSVDDFAIDRLIVDVKTHRLGTTLYQPNLISADRFMRLFFDGHHVLVYLFLKYSIQDGRAVVEGVETREMESICWSAMTIQNQGLGVIQLKNNLCPIPRALVPPEVWRGQMIEEYSRFCRIQSRKFSKILERLETPGILSHERS